MYVSWSDKNEIFQCDNTMWCCLNSDNRVVSWKFDKNYAPYVTSYLEWLENPEAQFPEDISELISQNNNDGTN